MIVEVAEGGVRVVERPDRGRAGDGGRDVVDGGAGAYDEHVQRPHSSPTVVQNHGMTRERIAAPSRPITAPVSAMPFSVTTPVE